MRKPIVSTITPCYNMKKYLKTFLEELPNQSFFDSLEVVLDHNAPSEEELAWVEQFKRDYPGHIKHIVVPHVDPIGVSMNRCIRESSGDFLCIWNVDDLRVSHSIESQVDLLKKEQSVDIVYGNFEIVKSFTIKRGEIIDCSRFDESEFTRSMIFGPFFMFRKNVLKRSGVFDEQLKSGADFDLSIRLAFNGKAKMVEENLGYYLNEGLGASTRKDSLQPIERTVIELRYGIYDKIDYHFLPRALKYNIYQLKDGDNLINIEDLVPYYNDIMNKRYSMWFEKGLIGQKKLERKRIFSRIRSILKKMYGVLCTQLV